jgi:hypothetical protein
MVSFQAIATKIRHGLFTHAALRQLYRFGIVIIPYYHNVTRAPFDRRQAPESISTTLLAENDIDEVARFEAPQGGVLPHPRQRVAAGDLCLVARSHGAIVGVTWANLTRYTLYGKTHPLEPSEAYIYHTLCASESRGLGLAPFLRCEFCRSLSEKGVDTVYCATEYWNRAAVRFKEKCGARKKQFRIYLRIGAWYRDYLIKSY